MVDGIEQLEIAVNNLESSYIEFDDRLFINTEILKEVRSALVYITTTGSKYKYVFFLMSDNYLAEYRLPPKDFLELYIEHHKILLDRIKKIEGVKNENSS